jgi:hypothetical protein
MPEHLHLARRAVGEADGVDVEMDDPAGVDASGRDLARLDGGVGGGSVGHGRGQ